MSRGVAAFLTEIMRDMDLVARSSDNSFCMMLPACSLDDATSAAERYRIAASKTPFQIDETELQLTLSAGVTLAAQGEPPDRLMERGQMALEKSVQAGGNRTSVEESPTEDDATDTDAAAVDDASAADEVAEADDAAVVDEVTATDDVTKIDAAAKTDKVVAADDVTETDDVAAEESDETAEEAFAVS